MNVLNIKFARNGLGSTIVFGRHRFLISRFAWIWHLNGEMMKQFQTVKWPDKTPGGYTLIGFWIVGYWKSKVAFPADNGNC